MYIPGPHEETDVAVLHSLMRSRPLGAWVLHADGELLVNHIPFLIDPDGEYGTLRGHIARANPAWKALPSANASLVIFQGAESYITPSWYPSKHDTGRAVPTWNYAVVHAHGTPRAIDDPLWLRDHLSRATDFHEADASEPWKLSDAPADFVDRLLGAIVGIEIPIRRLVGKWKTSQNRPDADKRGVVAGLLDRGDDRARAMADLVRLHVSEP